MKNEKLLIFWTRSYAYLGRKICAAADFQGGEIEVKEFPDGERYQRILTDVSDRSIALVGGTISDADTLEIYDIACALVKSGARHLNLVVPYFGYSTMERAEKPGEVVTAKTRARLFSAIPQAALGNRVTLLDLHADGIPYYFEGGITPVHLYAKPIITKAVRKLGGKNFVLASTDAGRAKWVQSLANDLGVEASFVFKRRLDSSTTRVLATCADVNQRDVVIYDDMIRTGSSLLNAAEAYRKGGAKSISAVTTHGVFPGDSFPRIKERSLLRRIICTDSHPRALSLQSDFLKVESIAGLLADHLKNRL